MARTQGAIEQQIDTSIAAEASLAGLTSTSKVAVWRGWKKVVASAIRQLELLWDAFLREMNAAAAAAVPGTEKWYAERMLEFQYGHALSEEDGRLFYLTEDEDAKIVKYVAVTSVGGNVNIKVAKDSSGDLVPLTDVERTALDSYIKAIKFAGTRHKLFSLPSDKVKVAATAYYDGKLDPTDFAATVEAALEAYLRNIFFNGELNINKLRDAAEEVIGMNDFQISLLEAKTDSAGSYTTVPHTYQPLSGYHEFDTISITYVAQ